MTTKEKSDQMHLLGKGRKRDGKGFSYLYCQMCNRLKARKHPHRLQTFSNLELLKASLSRFWLIIFVAPLILLTPLEQKLVDYSFHNRSLKFLHKSAGSYIAPKLIKSHYAFSKGNSNVDCAVHTQSTIILELDSPQPIYEKTLKTDCGMNNRPIFAPKVSKEAK